MIDSHPINTLASPECAVVLKHHRYTPERKSRNGRYVKLTRQEGICVVIELQITLPHKWATDVTIAFVRFERSPTTPFFVTEENVRHDSSPHFSHSFEKICAKLGIVAEVRDLFTKLGVLEAYRKHNQ
jgi:hypothetical protein